MVDNNCIYVLKDSLGQIRYVGQTTIGPTKRLRAHKAQAKAGRKHPVSCFVKKYMDSVVIEVIEVCPKETLNERERHWIKHYRDLGLKLLNLTNGGEGCSGFKMPKEIVEKQRLRLLGKPSRRKGTLHSEVTKNNIREGIRNGKPRNGKNNGFFGKKHSPETIARLKASSSHKGGHNKKSIICLDTNQTFDSSYSAAEAMGLKASSIRSVLQGKAKAIKGYRFVYV